MEPSLTASAQPRQSRDQDGGVGSEDELTQRNVETVAQLEAAEKEKRTAADRAVDAITAFCGSMAFVWVHVAWFGLWIACNTLPGPTHFDKFPFSLLTMIVSLEAILLSTFILITQNREAQLAERRNHLDLQVNLLSEQENTKMLRLLEQIASKLGVEVDDLEVKVLEEATRPEKLVEQIERATAANNKADNKASGNAHKTKA